MTNVYHHVSVFCNGRPCVSRLDRSYDSCRPLVTPVASHRPTDGLEALFMLGEPREVGTPPYFIGVIGEESIVASIEIQAHAANLVYLLLFLKGHLFLLESRSILRLQLWFIKVIIKHL